MSASACVPQFMLAGIAIGALSGCASAPMTRGGSLSSYERLKPSDGLLTKSLLHVDKEQVLAARSVRIWPTVFAPGASPQLSEEQRRLVANLIDRALCGGLSERLRIVGPDEPADLTTHVKVTQAAPTDEMAAGASKVASIVPSALGVRVPIPRIPIGLGSLTVESEAQDAAGHQLAAMVWARGANSFTNSPKVSAVSDPYDLGSSFATDFSQMLVTGTTPFGQPPRLPSLESIGTSLGGQPKYAACEAFGRDPGLVGMIAGNVGLPPEWSDKGAATNPP
ncbi:DUF3313 domain-containing protein [Bradyrhizobium sp. 2TAF24]|uniref:DUF3313 domain-containing protein n=1 Tax=Bradyrhizobium sp. 2TAF24 TaxID=3233011 RepID=UPI003F935394